MPTPRPTSRCTPTTPTGSIRSAISGNWKIDPEQTAAGGWSLNEPDLGAAKIPGASNFPINYFEASFLVEADVRIACGCACAPTEILQNDSVWVQFSDSVDIGGNPVWRIGALPAPLSSSRTAATAASTAGAGTTMATGPRARP